MFIKKMNIWLTGLQYNFGLEVFIVIFQED
jgi:hypothetical protein